MKKILIFLLAISLCLFAFCACDITYEEETDANTVDESTTSAPEKLGDYTVSILSCRPAHDYQGKPVIIVKFKFTNNDDDPASFFLTFDYEAYQNGVGLNTAYILDDDANYSTDNQTKEIKKGASLEVEVAFELNDSTTDVEVELSELISWRDDKITKVFKIKDIFADNDAETQTTPPASDDQPDVDTDAPSSDNDNNDADSNQSELGNYLISIESVRAAEDIYGKPVIIVSYLFTNNDDDAKSFSLAFDDEVYQNGIGLNTCYSVDDSYDYSNDNQYKDVKQGASITVEAAYELNDVTTAIDVEVQRNTFWSDKTVSKTFEISGLFDDMEQNMIESGKLGNFEVTIVSARIAESLFGDPIVIVKYAFTNNGDDSAAFSYSLSTDVFQDGIGLDKCYFVSDSANYSSDAQHQEIKPGVTIDVEVAYTLNDTSTSIDVQVSEFMSLNEKTVTKTIEIN